MFPNTAMHHLQVIFKKISTVILTIKEIKLQYVFTHQTIALTSTVNGKIYISTNISLIAQLQHG
jgi:hypothetical protein